MTRRSLESFWYIHFLFKKSSKEGRNEMVTWPQTVIFAHVYAPVGMWSFWFCLLKTTVSSKLNLGIYSGLKLWLCKYCWREGRDGAGMGESRGGKCGYFSWSCVHEHMKSVLFINNIKELWSVYLVFLFLPIILIHNSRTNHPLPGSLYNTM